MSTLSSAYLFLTGVFAYLAAGVIVVWAIKRLAGERERADEDTEMALFWPLVLVAMIPIGAVAFVEFLLKRLLDDKED